MEKPEIHFTSFTVQYGANGPRVDAVRLSCETRAKLYSIALTADGHRYCEVNGRIVPALPKTPYCTALETTYRQCVFLLSSYLHATGAARNGLFWEIKEAIK